MFREAQRRQRGSHSKSPERVRINVTAMFSKGVAGNNTACSKHSSAIHLLHYQHAPFKCSGPCWDLHPLRQCPYIKGKLGDIEFQMSHWQLLRHCRESSDSAALLQRPSPRALLIEGCWGGTIQNIHCMISVQGKYKPIFNTDNIFFLLTVMHLTLSFNPNTVHRLQSYCLKAMYSVQLLEHLLVLTDLAVL